MNWLVYIVVNKQRVILYRGDSLELAKQAEAKHLASNPNDKVSIAVPAFNPFK